MRLSVLLLYLSLAMGCDQAAPLPRQKGEPKSFRVELSAVAPLRPQRPTHLTVSPGGELYYVQEQSVGEDTVFALAPGKSPTATPLTSRAILAAMDQREGATGNIQSIVFDPSAAPSRLLFYFSGGTRKANLAAIGAVNLQTGKIDILHDTAAIERDSGLGASLAFARGTLVVSGGKFWIYLRHDSTAAVFCMPLMQAGRLPLSGVRIAKVTAGAETLQLNHEEIAAASGPGESLLLTDRWSGALWQVDPSGKAQMLENLVALPGNISVFAADTEGDIAGIFGDGNMIEPRVQARTDPAVLNQPLPVLLYRRKGKRYETGREDWRTPPNFALYALRPESLAYDFPGESWITFDSSSGQILRLRLTPVW